MFWFYGIAILTVSAVLLYISGELLVRGLVRLSRHFQVTEFFVAFFVMAFAATLPNIFVGVTSALQGIPELSFGDIMGNNLIALTIAVALGVFFAPNKELPLESDTVQDTTFLTAIAAILPLILISDGLISRSDGLVLLMFFFGYVYWMLTKRERFTRIFGESRPAITKQQAMYQVLRLLTGVALLAIAAQEVVYGATIIAEGMGMSLLLVGMLVIAMGGALPEIYFTVISARRGETGMIIGNLMGSVIIPATFVLGTVAMISPIHNDTLQFSTAARIFLVLVAAFFLVVSQTRSSISRREAIILGVSYVLFILSLFYLS